MRELLTACQTASRCVLIPGLSSVLEGVPNAKFAERRVEPRKSCTGDSAAICKCRSTHKPSDGANARAAAALEEATHTARAAADVGQENMRFSERPKCTRGSRRHTIVDLAKEEASKELPHPPQATLDA